jgi:hypothetical protein
MAETTPAPQRSTLWAIARQIFPISGAGIRNYLSVGGLAAAFTGAAFVFGGGSAVLQAIQAGDIAANFSSALNMPLEGLVESANFLTAQVGNLTGTDLVSSIPAFNLS